METVDANAQREAWPILSAALDSLNSGDLIPRWALVRQSLISHSVYVWTRAEQVSRFDLGAVLMVSDRQPEYRDDMRFPTPVLQYDGAGYGWHYPTKASHPFAVSLGMVEH